MSQNFNNLVDPSERPDSNFVDPSERPDSNFVDPSEAPEAAKANPALDITETGEVGEKAD
ncbi:MAG TPA: hypothetical protein VFA21_20890 [Pyrinomonadaceae bacterium]|jgi:hypothetical protein|nr:hypothetical protein [Pyrinomonadaceae bacterium]